MTKKTPEQEAAEAAREKEAERIRKLQDRYAPRDTPSILTQRREQLEIARLKAEIKNLTQELMESEFRKEIIQGLAKPLPAIPRREFKSGLNDGTAVVMASDWHVEATVDPDKVHGWNAFNPEIAMQRVDRLIYGIRSLLDLHRGKTKVRDLVLGMIGDMINGFIHIEYRQTNSMAPPSACRFFKQLAIHLFDSLLEDGDLERIIVPCQVGNHGRIDVKKPAAVAIENSFELMVYADLADHYKDEPRVSVGVPTGLVTYNRVYDFLLRWEHGDGFGYQGGIGGVFIPFNKHIARRDSKVQATVTHIGHWHQLKMLPHACINGALCGYDEYADSRGFEFEFASQGFYMLDSKQGPHGWSPIWVQRVDDSFESEKRPGLDQHIRGTGEWAKLFRGARGDA